MTNKELQELLKKYPDDLQVKTYDHAYCCVSDITIESIVIEHDLKDNEQIVIF